MLITSDFLVYLNRKKTEPRTARPEIQASLASSPGGQRKKSQPPSGYEGLNSSPDPEEVDYLNSRNSTLDVVL
ncbi:MAG: hypothetical protein LBK52_04730 [Deltaproteobacteria bacterium]|jgi:hypothetical protein|nr:hypothetical protein [Deltaproteobacteria bacterium]